MNTDKLFEALRNKAIYSEQHKIEQAIRNFEKALCHPNGGYYRSHDQKITINVDDAPITFKLDAVFNSLKKEILKSREETLIKREISAFMKAHENYTNQIHEMGNYLIENNQ